MKNIRLSISPLTKTVYAAKLNKNNDQWWYNNNTDITEDFKRCVVRYCSEETEFKVDGMRFKATCERIE